MHGTGTLFLRDTEGFAHQRRDHLRRDDLARQLGQRLHRRDDVDDLEARLPGRQNPLLAGDHDHRHRAKQRIGGAGRKIERAGAKRGDADTGLAGQPAIGGGHEGGRLLMAGQDKLDRRAADKFDDVEIFLARNAKNPIDPFVLQGRNEQIRTFGHGRHPHPAPGHERAAARRPGLTRPSIDLDDRMSLHQFETRRSSAYDCDGAAGTGAYVHEMEPRSVAGPVVGRTGCRAATGSSMTSGPEEAIMANALSDQERALMDAYWRAANYLSVGQIYLYDNPLLKKPLARRAHQAAAARPLGHHAGPELHLRPPEPGHQGARPRHDLRHRPRPRRPGAGRQRLPGGHLQRGLPEHLAGRGRA